MSRKVVFSLKEGLKANPSILGGKGHGLAVMASLDIPVPPALTVSTTVARSFTQFGVIPPRMATQLHRGILMMEKATGKKFGDPTNPLLVSVRSGAKVSMPGMMDTILNLGMNKEIVEGLALKTNQGFAEDCYKRFLQMFGETVFNIPGNELKGSIEDLRTVIAEKIGRPFPDDPMSQLSLALLAVLKSWNSARAKVYRREHKIPDWWGTAVNIQAMVFGNLSEDSGTGVVFSRNVADGSRGLYGEFLPNAQGEDIVAGIRTPQPIAEMLKWNHVAYRQLEVIVQRLEDHFNDVVDVEFTVERGRLYILQVRSAKRSPEAACTIATNFVWEKRWTKEEALQRARKMAVSAAKPSFDPKSVEKVTLLAKGLNASPGAAVGIVCLSPEKAVRWAKGDNPVILVRHDTSPNDLSGMIASTGIVTATGGRTSHAAVVARGMDKPAVVGVDSLEIRDESVLFAGFEVSEGEWISIDGSAGNIYYGKVDLAISAVKKKEVNIFLKWVKESEPPTPDPRIDFSRMKSPISENFLLNEFYITDAMLAEAENHPIHETASEHRNTTHYRTAEHLACYIAVAVAGELRHSFNKLREPASAGCGCLVCRMKVEQTDGDYEEAVIARDRLSKYYGVGEGGGRSATQTKVISNLSKMDNQGLIEFFQLAHTVFSKFRWEGGYGGPNWATIALAPLRFLSREFNHSVFADHVFDLEHNNGSVFGKHMMFNGNRDRIKKQLNDKKKAKGVKELWQKLSCHGTFSAQTNGIFNEGVKLKIW